MNQFVKQNRILICIALWITVTNSSTLREHIVSRQYPFGDRLAVFERVPDGESKPVVWIGARPVSRQRRHKDTIPLMLGKATAATTPPPENPMGFGLNQSCTVTSDCNNYVNTICTSSNKCNCTKQFPVFLKKAGGCIKAAVLNSSCDYNEQCVHKVQYSQCTEDTKVCTCLPYYEMKEFVGVGHSCVTKGQKPSNPSVDPAMIGVLAGLALMFIIICVVLRLFSKARFRENRSIFNTPNPRLMNASLFKDSKLLSPSRGDRRGSRASVRAPPSRAQSISSVYKDVPGRCSNGSIAKERRGSAISNVSATGSVAGAASRNPPTSPTRSTTQKETTVAIEAVD